MTHDVRNAAQRARDNMMPAADRERIAHNARMYSINRREELTAMLDKNAETLDDLWLAMGALERVGGEDATVKRLSARRMKALHRRTEYHNELLALDSAEGPA